MGSVPETTNQAANTANTVINSLEGSLVNAAEALCIAAYPWLGTPGIKQIWEAIFGFIASKFEQAAQTGATFTIIDVQVTGEESALSAALKALITAEKSGDQNAIQEAIKNYANANSSLIHDDGSSSS